MRNATARNGIAGGLGREQHGPGLGRVRGARSLSLAVLTSPHPGVLAAEESHASNRLSLLLAGVVS